MSILCLEYYSLIENNALHFDEILDTIKTDNDNLMSWCITHDFINKDLKDLLDRYPKFLNYSNLNDIKLKRSGYNQERIHNSTTMNYNQLTQSILKDTYVRTLQKTINNIPEYYDDQVKEFTFQKSYINSISESYFNKNLFIYNYLNTNYSDKFSSLLNEKYGNVDSFQRSQLNKHSFFHMYFLNTIVNYIFKEKSNLLENLTNNINDFDIPNLSGSLSDHTENIIDVVLANQFSFVDISDDFKIDILESEEIQTSILEVETLFNKYLIKNLTTFKSNITETLFDLMNNNLSFEFTKAKYHLSSRFDFDEINQMSYEGFIGIEPNDLMNLYLPTDVSNLQLTDFENNMYIFHVSSLNNTYSIKNYFYLLYLYRNKIQKFISILDPIAVDYVYNNIRFGDVYYFNNFDKMNQLFAQWVINIRYDIFVQDLNRTYTSDRYLSVLENNPDILKFSLVYEFYKQIESFVKTDGFKQKAINIQNSIFTYLRSRGIISANVDWCDSVFPLEVYLFFALKNIAEDVDTTTLEAYSETQIENTTYKQFENQDEFDLFIEDFNNKNSYYLFEFYKAFTNSMIGSIFSKAFHLKYSL